MIIFDKSLANLDDNLLESINKIDINSSQCGKSCNPVSVSHLRRIVIEN